MTDNFGVKVTGIREFGRALKKVDASLPKSLQGYMYGIAENVAGTIRAKMPHVSGRAAGSVKPKARSSGASIAWGGTAAPYMPWLDFGGSVGKGHQTGVAWSGSVKREWKGVPTGSGRYVYPSISEARSDTEAAIDLAIKEVAEAAGFETRGSL